MSQIVLVRHALSVADPDVDSTRWGLADGAAGEAAQLARCLPDDTARIWTSAERKAVDTARAIADVLGAEVAIDERFGEVVRPWTADDYASLAQRYLAGEAIDGWESADAVRERFRAAVDDIIEDGPAVIVNHGLAMSLYVASMANVDVTAFWTSLTFPDAWMLERANGALERVFTEGRPAPAQT